MKVGISVDMEGPAGISRSGAPELGDDGRPAAVGLTIGEADAAVEGGGHPELHSATACRRLPAGIRLVPALG